MNLAFEITNQLLNAGYIIEDVVPTKVQVLVASVLRKDPRLRAAIIHLQDERHDKSMPVCHQIGDSLVIADDSTVVTCRKCLRWIAVHKVRRGEQAKAGLSAESSHRRYADTVDGVLYIDVSELLDEQEG